MQPMTLQETTGYLQHHTRLAGRSDALFSDDAAAFIHHTARGYPRAVGRLAVAALIATYATRKTIADEAGVMPQVTGCLLQGHRLHGVADGDPLVERYLQPQLTCL